MKKKDNEKICYHCGDRCGAGSVRFQDKLFCCKGCKTVFEILNEYQLTEYYEIEEKPGIQSEKEAFTDFAYLDIPEVRDQVIQFSDGKMESVTLKIPSIHCSSCIWLLEKLDRLEPAVQRSEVNFLRKEVSITYSSRELSLRRTVELLDRIGYSPVISLDEKERKKANRKRDLSFFYRLGISGFAFGNIMLLSFPEYFDQGMYEDPSFGAFFGYINLLLATPVFLYCASPYFVSAYKGLRQRYLNIDVPVSLGVFVLYSRSAYEILTHTGAGYMDSMTGLVFFLLVGRWFQNRTYQALSFEKNYQHYFPLGVTRLKDGKRETVLLKEVEKGDRLLISRGELVPADAYIRKGQAVMDYSFVTGEADAVPVGEGELLYAGGRQTGEQIEVEIAREFSQSYLMQLWKHEDRGPARGRSLDRLIDRVSQYFTSLVLFIALVAGLYWWNADGSEVVHVVTSVLIIACPCALALSIPFTYGNGLKLLERAGIYLKDALFIEKLSQVDYLVFDKTGTITSQTNKDLRYSGEELSPGDSAAVRSLVSNSGHPLSRAIYDHLSDFDLAEVSDFREELGQGLTGRVEGRVVKVGSAKYLGLVEVNNATTVHLEIDGHKKGYFTLGNLYRPGLETMLRKLGGKMPVEVVTGDGDGERENLRRIFGKEAVLTFEMTPMDKLERIRELQNSGNKVLMIGDGLNDAGAISESHVGISISDNIYGFLPSCDAILESGHFHKLADILAFSRSSVKAVKFSFAISFTYNLVGMYFAVNGLLSPVLAAILMPLSSISVVAFAILTTNMLAKRHKFFSFGKNDESHSLS